MPPPRPLYARCGPPPVHSLHALLLRRRARLAPWIFMIDRQRLVLERWRRNWSRRYTLCSDLNSQPKRPGDLDLWPFDLESGVRVTCDVVYLCANFSLPRPLCSRVRPDVRDRQTPETDVRQKHRLIITPPIRGGGIIIWCTKNEDKWWWWWWRWFITVTKLLSHAKLGCKAEIWGFGYCKPCCSLKPPLCVWVAYNNSMM